MIEKDGVKVDIPKNDFPHNTQFYKVNVIEIGWSQKIFIAFSRSFDTCYKCNLLLFLIPNPHQFKNKLAKRIQNHFLIAVMENWKSTCVGENVKVPFRL